MWSWIKTGTWWMTIIGCVIILISFPISATYGIFFPWPQGEQQLAQKQRHAWQICMGISSESHWINEGVIEDTSGSWGIRLDPASAIEHPSLKGFSLHQRVYLVPMNLTTDFGLWSVTENQDGEFDVHESPASLLAYVMVDLLCLGFLIFAYRRLRKPVVR